MTRPLSSLEKASLVLVLILPLTVRADQGHAEATKGLFQ
jgi:hypothetical protein